MELLRMHTDFKTCLIPSVELALPTRLWDLSGTGGRVPETPSADTPTLRVWLARFIGLFEEQPCLELVLCQQPRTGRPQVGKE